MKIIVIYDNRKLNDNLLSDWGFSCLIEGYGKRYLFDTGANANILFENMHKLGLSDKKVDAVFISHPHLDHIGGLMEFLKKNECEVYIPYSFPRLPHIKNAKRIKEITELSEHFYSTGELNGIEQSMVIEIKGGVVVIVGCGHSGIKKIMETASKIGTPKWLIGGLHGFNDFEVIKDLEYFSPMHCTLYMNQLKKRYPTKFIPGGAGKIFEIE